MVIDKRDMSCANVESVRTPEGTLSPCPVTVSCFAVNLFCFVQTFPIVESFYYESFAILISVIGDDMHSLDMLLFLICANDRFVLRLPHAERPFTAIRRLLNMREVLHLTSDQERTLDSSQEALYLTASLCCSSSLHRPLPLCRATIQTPIVKRLKG